MHYKPDWPEIPEKTANIIVMPLMARHHLQFQHKMMSEEQAKKFHSDDMSVDQVDAFHY